VYCSCKHNPNSYSGDALIATKSFSVKKFQTQKVPGILQVLGEMLSAVGMWNSCITSATKNWSCFFLLIHFLQSTLLLFLWEKMMYTICGGKTPIKKNKPTMPYMQLFKLHLICIFSWIYLANVKNWPKTVIFTQKSCFAKFLQKYFVKIAGWFRVVISTLRQPQITNSKKNQLKPCVWRLKHQFYVVFQVSNPKMARKPKNSRKPMLTSNDKKSYMARLVLMKQV